MATTSSQQTAAAAATSSRGRTAISSYLMGGDGMHDDRPPIRMRSLSTGRRRPGPGRATIVQDVYERMGMTYTPPARNSGNNPEKESEKAASAESNKQQNPHHDKYAFAQRYCAVAAAANRGRSAQVQEQPEQRRARSLSRGRKLERTWPPPSTLDRPSTPTLPTLDNEAPSLQQPPPASSAVSPSSPNRTWVKSAVTPTSARNNESSSTYLYGAGGDLFRATSFDTRPRSKSREYHQEEKKLADPEDLPPVGSDMHEETTSASSPDDQNIPSIQDRIHAYSGGSAKKNKKPTSSTFSSKFQYAAQFAVRERPPKVDLYDSVPLSRVPTDEQQQHPYLDDEDQDANKCTPTASSTASPASSSMGGGDGGSPLEEGRNARGWRGGGGPVASGRHSYPSKNPVVSSPSASSYPTRTTRSNNKNPTTTHGAGVATAYMDAIQNNKKASSETAEFLSPEVVQTTSSGLNDGHSVALSSVSGGEDFAGPSPSTQQWRNNGQQQQPPSHNRRPSWQDRNRVHAYGGVRYNSNSPGQNRPSTASDSALFLMDGQQQQRPPGVSQQDAEAWMAQVESRMQATMRSWMDRMDETILSRLEALEQKMDHLSQTVESMQRQQSTSRHGRNMGGR